MRFLIFLKLLFFAAMRGLLKVFCLALAVAAVVAALFGVCWSIGKFALWLFPAFYTSIEGVMMAPGDAGGVTLLMLILVGGSAYVAVFCVVRACKWLWDIWEDAGIEADTIRRIRKAATVAAVGIGAALIAFLAGCSQIQSRAQAQAIFPEASVELVPGSRYKWIIKTTNGYVYYFEYAGFVRGAEQGTVIPMFGAPPHSWSIK